MKNNKKALATEMNKFQLMLEMELPFGAPTNVQTSNTMTRQEMQDMYDKMFDTPLPVILDLMQKAELAKSKASDEIKNAENDRNQQEYYRKIINVAAKQIAVLRHLPAYRAHMKEKEDQRREENRKSSEARLAAMSPEEKKMADIYAQYGGKANYEAGRGLGT